MDDRNVSVDRLIQLLIETVRTEQEIERLERQIEQLKRQRTGLQGYATEIQRQGHRTRI
ncbi:MAG: hypothetical protein MUC48_24690 [Leptolyngbya sp. Prado105]|nr:hypothetical protein [Leptolyngbya sp. Prado105]